MDRTTFGIDEVDAVKKSFSNVYFGSAYWVSVGDFLPSELGLNPTTLSSLPTSSLPTIGTNLDPTLPAAVSTAITNMLWLSCNPFGIPSFMYLIQCVIAEIHYDDAPIVPNATTATSDKLAQRNIA